MEIERRGRKQRNGWMKSSGQRYLRPGFTGRGKPRQVSPKMIRRLVGDGSLWAHPLRATNAKAYVADIPCVTIALFFLCNVNQVIIDMLMLAHLFYYTLFPTLSEFVV